MKFTTIYRADEYYQNFGNLLGFFNDLEDAKSEIEFSNEVKNADGTFSRITEFTVLTSELEKGDIEDTEFMMELWSEGKIVTDYYFK